MSYEQNKSSFGNKGTERMNLGSIPENPEQLVVPEKAVSLITGLYGAVKVTRFDPELTSDLLS